MQFVATQLLVDTVVGDSSEFIAIKAIEPYGRYVLEDAHHARRFTPEQSTFPTKEGNGGHVQAYDLLVVSSHRLHHESVNLGAHITHSEPSIITRIFLNKQLIQRAYDFFKKDDIEEANTMPCLYQLKQV
ncbi:hypothetical protein G6F57_009111 [Rhizopus arrhizus]|nr:hypothetical protein G6F22_003298 [Rhizopus arrhizus]KAG0808166.1 hypothetical protein G6F20_009798 [Rhizopus arrhizus]KAG0866115.1 hypothetical protein G6F16_009712 [Rhizopus arrhizus]KAG0877868.1 hypothetical protein G6F15_009716 [Rhizopus arrhizus]KAG0893608.1 hypothetical protein G6F34_009835 [Rhizopus arrhizus]